MCVFKLRQHSCLLPAAAHRSHQDAGIDGRWRQDVIPEQPTVTLMAQGLQAVIVDLKDKVGRERPWRSSPPVTSQSWGLVLKREPLGAGATVSVRYMRQARREGNLRGGPKA